MATDTGSAGGAGFTVMDGVALVAGAAVASVHLRGLFVDDLPGIGRVIVLAAFAWMGLTSAGPFVFLVRRFARSLPGYPRTGDRLWGLLGLPWLLTALVQTGPAHSAPGSAPGPLLATLLTVGLGATSLVAMAAVWGTWVAVTPGQASEAFSGPWTNRVGLVLAIAWPIQCGLGMVVIA